ncbi:MAG: response regulator transcription factor [Bacteroidales bacterium]|nr:response regulator transcription factor [Clostridium sp.]MCM1204932.1 response regulator transcription factor [Bacteroidales bacterium]
MQETILIVDDEAEIREMLKQIFQLEGYMVYTAGNGYEALDKVSSLMYKASEQRAGDADADVRAGVDMILLDVNMPELDGYEVCKRIREYVSCPILFLSARIDDEDKVNGFRVGGDDYIEKPFSMTELTERVSAHLRRQKRQLRTEGVGFAGVFAISYSARQVLFGKEEVPLTKTEYEIVEFLSRHKNQVFTKEMIYERLWGFDKDGESSIITEHIRRIRQKLKKYTEEMMIETVWGVGYRWIG